MDHLIFDFFAVFTVVCAAGVVINRNAVNAAMCLLLCLAGVAGLFVQLQAFLLAFLLILIYAGAVVALFLFIIMLLDIQGRDRAKRRMIGGVVGVVTAVLLAAGVSGLVGHARSQLPVAPATPAIGASLRLYAERLFSIYLLPVEVTGFLLLIAMIGVIVISRRAADEPSVSSK